LVRRVSQPGSRRHEGKSQTGADTTPAARISAIEVMGDSQADVGTVGLRFTVQGSGNLTYPELIGENDGLGRGCDFFAFNGVTFVADTAAGCTNHAIDGGVINGAASGLTAADPRPTGTGWLSQLISLELARAGWL
jgi:outer membrane lipase/esterase